MSRVTFPSLVCCVLGACLVCAPALFAQSVAEAPPETPPEATSSATGAIEGRVATLDGVGVPGARVELVDRHVRVRSDDDGRFRFDRLEPHAYLVYAEALGVGQMNRRVMVAAGEVAQVELILELMRHDDEVVVTGSAVARSQLELAQPTTVLSGEELRFRQQATLGDTLSQEAGISASTFGAGASRPVVRGLGGDRVRMLQGGVGVGDASSTSPDHAVSAEPAVAERIEVLRGPATLLYGSSAIGGVVNVLDGRIPDHRPDAELSGFVDLAGGSVSNERTAAAALGGGRGDWAWHIDGSFRDTDDYEIPGFANVDGEHEDEEHDEEHEDEEPAFGVVPNSDLESRTAAVGATRFFDRGFVGVSLSAYESDYGIPGVEHAHGEEEGHDESEDDHGDEEEGGVRIDLERLRYDVRAEITEPFGPFAGLKFRLGVTDYEHSELEGADGEVGTTFFNDEREGRLELVQTERAGFSGSFGLQVRSQDLLAVGEEAFLPPVETFSWALFAFEEKQLTDDVLLQFGGRYEAQEVDAEAAALFGAAHSRSFDGFSSSLGLVWEFTDGWALAGSVARSVKLPNAEELYSDGPHFATNDFEVGDPGLDDETSLGVDIALRKNSGRVTGELTLFRNAFDRFIYKRFTGDEEDGLPVVVYTQADADFTGAELQARAELWQSGDRHLDLKLTGDVVRAELKSGSDLPRIPPRRLSAGLHYHRPAWHVYAEVWDVAGQDRVAELETPTGGHTLVHAGVSWRYLGDARIYDVILRGRNLTDEEARNHVSFLKDSVPLPGRDVSLALRLTF